ncbi:hypothetical protein [Acinetobacter tandoii]|uniref:Uncharacterized protein n=2 Tax=Acinetobacter tandoii TaxID=202954 RepID=R9B5H0_9GAMM|nr:hypothetical protein [Acinetobacter tandoii]EOR09525.1 hypothetical protein I593_00992 [Acinetobacter tandoii DSM 14970 = CIP 107469]EOR09923.1 hypothetical protein I593_00850 [Acinetobacter tandoii DSM 14970 = CIP 107469]EOR10786.1 hypothetical protein I593_00577 [Acinetobacter tandoii DSM 14970 = CIP 107469]EOR11253.1 hypothetical protein I593_00033 [Acinetobacter tandoii DSM 14970 = CIP 107469]
MFLKSINIISDIITPAMPNYTLDNWLPLDNTPITCDKEGNVISVFSDDIWDFTPYCIKPMKFNFGSNQTKGYIIDKDNIQLFKIIVAYWLWGASPKVSAITIVNRCTILKPLFYVCSKHNILISELRNHEEIYEEIAAQYKGKRRAIGLQELVSLSKDIGFTILDEDSLRKFSKYLVVNDSNQTPYIPPRIWAYQLERLENCIDDFLSISDGVVSVFNCFVDNHNKTRNFINEKFNKYNVTGMLQKWTDFDSNTAKAPNLSKYLSMVSFVSIAYIVNFSLMRISEAYLLRYGCFSKTIIDGQEICLIHGITSKTEKGEASWVVSPSVEKAVRALEIICELRFSCAKELFGILQDINDYKPYLHSPVFEPWGSGRGKNERLEQIRSTIGYANQIGTFDKIFEQEEFQITQADFNIACKMTPNLDIEIYQVGKVWHFAWHQLRRTGAVNMLASGLITEQSLQYQLKHANTIMSLYYANNYYKLKFKLDDAVGQIYLEEWHQNNVRKNMELDSPKFISPHGHKRKAQIISAISEKDHTQLLRMSEQGNLNYRETFLGGCTKTGAPCPYGGISNIVQCMGGSNSLACDAVLLDKKKVNTMLKLEQSYLEKIKKLEKESISTVFQTEQLASIRKAIYVIQSNE